MKYRGVFVPFGKMLPDQPSTGDGLEVCDRLILTDGVYQRMRAKNLRGDLHGYSGQKLRDVAVFHSESAQYLYAAVSQHIFEVNPTTGALTDRCKGGHYTASTWSLLPFGAIMVAASSDNPLQAVTPGGAFADLATSTTKPRGKYLCACRGHIILGNITAPAVNPREIRWSGRYQPADWEPGSNRSGFNEFFGDVGVITGLAGFEDFFLVFTTKAVIRASFIGGDAVWSYQQIGSLHDGMPLGLWRSIVAVGRDAYYLSRTGPKVVVSGEGVRDLAAGSVRRSMLDPNSRVDSAVGLPPSVAIPFASPWTPAGALDSLRRVVVWAWPAQVSGGISNDHSILAWAYSIDDDSWSTVSDDSTPFGTTGASENVMVAARDYGASLATPTGDVLSGILLAYSENQGQGVFLVGYDSPTGHVLGRVVTKLSDFGPGQTAIFAVRPRLQFMDSTLPYPGVKVTVRAFDNMPLSYGETPDRTVSISNIYTAGSMDERGFAFFPSGPVRGAFFSFVVDVYDTGVESRKLRDFTGLDLLLDPEKSDR